MKRAILTIASLIICAAGFAQSGEWISKFDNIVVNGAVKLTIIEQSDTLPPKMSYNLNGGREDYFSATVDNDGVLTITERAEKGRETTTEITIYTPAFKGIKASAADIWFKGVYKSLLFDVELLQKARLSGEVNLQDLKVKLSGKSSAQLSGQTRYLTLEVSSSNVIATDLDAVSTRVVASQKSNVDVNASDRLEVEASSSAKVFYGSDPNIVRIYTGYIEGEVSPRQE